jgi:hypothetical protein
MRNARPIRRVVAEQLDGRHGVDLTAIAHAFEDEFGVELPPEQVRRIGSYGELLQLLSDVLAGDAEPANEDELASCFVRARVMSGGAHGRVLLVRVGWLTPDLASAIADDVRHAPAGTRLEVLVPDDLSDGELSSLRQWLRWLVSQHVHVDVRRTAQASPTPLGPPDTPTCGDLSQPSAPQAAVETSPNPDDPGTTLAASSEHQTNRVDPTNRRRSEQ